MRLNSQSFATLESEWAKQCDAYDDDFQSYATPSVDLARSVANEEPQHPNYGIYALSAAGDDFSGIVHVNRARLPKTDGTTLRVLWLLLAPKHDFEDVAPELLATISARLIVGVFTLAKNELRSDHVKIHLGNAVDRSYFTGIAVALSSQGLFKDCQVKGQWLHFSL